MVGGVGVEIVTDEGFEVGTVALLLPLLLFPQLLTAKAISNISATLVDRISYTYDFLIHHIRAFTLGLIASDLTIVFSVAVNTL